MKLKIWTLTTDTDYGTTSAAFTTEAEQEARAWDFVLSYFPDDQHDDLGKRFSDASALYGHLQSKVCFIDTMTLDSHELELPAPPGYAELLALAREWLDELMHTVSISDKDNSQIKAQRNKCIAAIAAAEAGQVEPLRVVVEVEGGVADVTTCPPGVDVEIIDHDNLEADLDKADQKWESQ